MMTTCPFEDYLRIPAWGYSGIKLNGVDKFEPTAKMRLGTHVHNYLGSPKAYKYEDIDLVRPVAVKLKEVVGERLLEYCEPEMTVTADFVHEGFKMKYKGRLDLGIFGKLVIDFKVTEMDIRKAIEYFGYHHQQSGYALAIDAQMALIIAIHPKKLTTQIFNVPIRTDFWEYHIKQKGEPIL